MFNYNSKFHLKYCVKSSGECKAQTEQGILIQETTKSIDRCLKYFLVLINKT